MSRYEAAELIEKARIDRGLNKSELSRKSGVNYQSLYLVLNAKENYGYAVFTKLVRYLDLDLSFDQLD